jgi:predicted acylesterase/phospholipase RssA
VYRLADGTCRQRVTEGDVDRYVEVELDERQCQQIVLASTAMPVIWPPENCRSLPALRAAVDGGLRNINPIGDVLDALDSPDDEVVIISCSPRTPSRLAQPPATGVEVALRSLEIALDEVARTDIHEFERINDLVEQASRKGVVLKNGAGEPLRSFRWHVIEPDESLDDTLDFSPEAIGRSIAKGREKARRVLDRDESLDGRASDRRRRGERPAQSTTATASISIR